MPATPEDSRFRLLIVRTGAMGDVLHAMPAVAALRLHHPEWLIGWAIEPRWRPLLEASTPTGPVMPLVDRIHDVPTRSWNQRPFTRATLSEILHLRRELRAERYDLCVDMQGLLRSAAIGRFARARKYVGSATPRERAARWFYRQTIHLHAAHVIDRGCELLGGAIGEHLDPAPIPIPVDTAAERWCDALLASLPNWGRCFAILAPTAGWGAKRWPTERYGAVAAALASAGVTPLINAATENDPVAAAMVRASGGCAIPVPCSLPELSALVRRASLVLAGDTGPLHLAAALHRPVVALFGPTDPRRTGPWATPSQVIRHASSREDHRRHADPEDGLGQITVEEVTAAAFDLLHRSSGEEGAA